MESSEILSKLIRKKIIEIIELKKIKRKKNLIKKLFSKNIELVLHS